MVSGCLMYTVLVANATAMIANVDPAAKEYKSKVLMGDAVICCCINEGIKYLRPKCLSERDRRSRF